MENLGFGLTRHGVKPTNKKIGAIKNTNPTTSQKETRQFPGVVNHYCNIWPRRSHKLVPLTKITSNRVKFK